MSVKSRVVAGATVVSGSGSVEDGFGRERVSDIQRARMLAAMVEVVGERGASNVTVADVVARSGVSRRTFYEVFDDREDCFLAAFEDAIAKIACVVVPAYEQESGWRERIRAGLAALLGFLDCEPNLGRLVIVEALGAGPRAVECRARVLDKTVDVVDEGRGESSRGEHLLRLTAEGVVGAVLSVLHTRLLAYPGAVEGVPSGRAARSKGLAGLVNPLMGMIVLPYLGEPASRRELECSTPRRRGAPRRGVSADPLRDLEMRLTYRTIRVLSAVAECPGSSNRRIAQDSGISDQGQISKLLARLQGLGLVENVGTGGTRGEPNAWSLTGKGTEVHGVIAESTTQTTVEGASHTLAASAKL